MRVSIVAVVVIALCSAGDTAWADDVVATQPVTAPVPITQDGNPVYGQAIPSLAVKIASAAARRSISCGAANRGALASAVEMPQRGPGFLIPEPWWSRGHRYGTGELVGLIMRAAAAVEAQHPGGFLGVADLSGPEGGYLRGHKSHQAGRDADLLFYTLDISGQPFHPDQHMPYFSHTGLANYAKAPEWNPAIPERYFDIPRNWALVKAMLNDPEVRVQHIFLSHRIRRWLLEYARLIGEPEELIQRAAITMIRPQDSNSHNDHMHVRVLCSADDIALGNCRDAASSRRSRSYRPVRCPVAEPLVVLPPE